jgi:ATP-binding cassette subfamily C (CFTR/MRP) protein 1
MLFYILGLSFFAGIGVFVLAFITNLIIGLILEKQQIEIMKRKDMRMNHTTEAINNIKTLKLYNWSSAFEKEIKKRRDSELQMFRKIAFWLSLIISSLYFFPQVLSSVVFSTYIGTGHFVDLSTAFSVLIFFELIKEPMRQLPTFISSTIQLLVSMRRI